MIPATDTKTLVSMHEHFFLFLSAGQIIDLEVSSLILAMINFGNFAILDVLTAVTMSSNISGMGCHAVWCMHSKHSACCLLGILFHPEDRCMYLCNVSELPSDYATSHPRRQYSGNLF
jgi:hypothetical protein